MKKLAKKLQEQTPIETSQTAQNAEFPSITPFDHNVDNYLPSIPPTPLPPQDINNQRKDITPSMIFKNMQNNQQHLDNLNNLQQRVLDLQKTNERQHGIIEKLMMEGSTIKKANGNLESIATKQINDICQIDKKLKEQQILIIALKNENVSIHEKYKQLQTKHSAKMEEQKELEIKYNALKSKQSVHSLEDCDHSQMNAEDIAKMIISWNVERYSHYYVKIVANMKKEGIDGNCLDELEKSDLYRLGITLFKDKRDIFKKIKELVHKKKNAEKSNEGLAN